MPIPALPNPGAERVRMPSRDFPKETKRGRLHAAAIALVCLTGCATTHSIGTTASSFMMKVRDSNDPNIRHLAYASLANQNCYDDDNQRAEAATILAAKLEDRSEPRVTRAVICRTLGELGRPEARSALASECDDPDPIVRAAACRALGKLKNSEDASILSRIMIADQDADCRIAAIEGLSNMPKSDPRTHQMLVQGMESPDPAIRLASYDALKILAGRDLGPDPKPWRAQLDAMTRSPDEVAPPSQAARSVPQ